MSAGDRPEEAPVGPPVPHFTEDSEWRNRDEFFRGREAIVAFLRRKWARERGYMRRRDASINDVPIEEAQRRYRT